MSDSRTYVGTDRIGVNTPLVGALADTFETGALPADIELVSGMDGSAREILITVWVGNDCHTIVLPITDNS